MPGAIACVRRPIHLDEALVTFLVVLVDENMVVDPSWERDLEEMVRVQVEIEIEIVRWEAGAPKPPGWDFWVAQYEALLMTVFSADTFSVSGGMVE